MQIPTDLHTSVIPFQKHQDKHIYFSNVIYFFRATQEIQDLDKQIDKLIKERKGKLAELKKIQKEKMNILIA